MNLLIIVVFDKIVYFFKHDHILCYLFVCVCVNLNILWLKVRDQSPNPFKRFSIHVNMRIEYLRLYLIQDFYI